jgi:hypothetical protein
MRQVGSLRIAALFDSLRVSMDHRIKPGGDEQRSAWAVATAMTRVSKGGG